MNSDGLLPIGSVVLLKNATHRIMIVGFSPIFQGNEMKVYDYSGTFYPEGVIKPDQQLVFNKSDIDKIYAQGYSDDAEKEFRKKVEDVLNKIRDEKGNLVATPEELFEIIENGGK